MVLRPSSLLVIVACGVPEPITAPAPSPAPTTPRPGPPTVEDLELVTPEDEMIEGRLVTDDPDDERLYFSVRREPENGRLFVGVGGIFRYHPDHDFNGADSFQVDVSDREHDAVTATVSIVVEPVNDAPRVLRQDRTATDGIPASGTVNAIDPEDDPLTFSIASPASHGDLVLDALTGDYVYEADPGFSGPDAFDVQASDGEFVARGTVSLTVFPLLFLPPTVPILTFEDTPVSATLAGFPAGPLTVVEIDEPPTLGTVSLDRTSGSFVYTPDPDAFGTDAFTVVANNTITQSRPNPQSITIQPVNDAPVLTAPGPLTTSQDTEVTGQLSATDVEGDPVLFLVVADPLHGAAVVDGATGAFGYTPDPGFTGTDQLEVAATDGLDQSPAARIDITVK